MTTLSTDECLGASKEEPIFIPGNEGLGEVIEVGPRERIKLKETERVVSTLSMRFIENGSAERKFVLRFSE